MSGRDWLLTKLPNFANVSSAAPIGQECILINRKSDFPERELSPFTCAIISAHHVTHEELSAQIDHGVKFDFIANIPKGAIWNGSAIAVAEDAHVGWGGIGELMSALDEPEVRGFEKKEYQFVFRNLRQHTNIKTIHRLFDRLVEIHRHDYGPLTAVLLYEYELTAERIRNARDLYGHFSAVVRTNPNGGATGSAHSVAAELGAEIFQWGQFLGRLNKA